MKHVNLKYEILGAETVQQLEKLVRDAIADGWEPQGGVCVARLKQSNPAVDYDGLTVWTQAMIWR